MKFLFRTGGTCSLQILPLAKGAREGVKLTLRQNVP